MALTDELAAIAEATGRPLARLSAGRDRYGQVDAILFAANGYVSVRTSQEGRYDVTIWNDTLAAWGSTSSTHDVVRTMRSFQDGGAVQDGSGTGHYLTVVGGTNVSETVEALWQLVMRYGDEELREIVTAAAANATTRRLRPWVSHGTLHLLRESYDAKAPTGAIAFHPFDGSQFLVHVYGEQEGTLVPDAQAAVALAARVAEKW